MQLWQVERPSEQALASKQPFCLDTLRFEQWLQFIFVERMMWLIDQRQALPEQFGLAPMCEESFVARGIDGRRLSVLLKRLDEALSAG
ncbi:putative protein YqcC [Sinobacterium norvegicum]|uniref:YqcC-like domain-containing protein n=2 Tax=Sinobacterium norvegicum TaxID=1641715 RepID=A0ABM9AK41_9GAMM|nr:putative protein YqcC [Sinobacterium norvegicum]